MKVSSARSWSWVLSVSLLLVLTGGCASNYRWTRNVPAQMCTVSVPTFRNESELVQIGSLMSRELLREFQREGTFSIKPRDVAAIEIQGVVKSVSSGATAYNRRLGLRLSSYDCIAIVEVSVIDRNNSKVLIDNRSYTVKTSYTASQDITTAQRDASGRLAEDLARQVVDDVLAIKW